jgi:hypothetical protein
MIILNRFQHITPINEPFIFPSCITSLVQKKAWCRVLHAALEDRGPRISYKETNDFTVEVTAVTSASCKLRVPYSWVITRIYIYIVTDFLKAPLGSLAPTLRNNGGYVILADV